MPFERASLSTIRERIAGDLNIGFGGGAQPLRRAGTRVLATAMAGCAHGLYGYIAWLAKQLLPDTAEGEWLERHARLFGIYRKQATAAAGVVVFTGVDGAIIPAGASLLRGDAVEYITTADAVIAGGSASVACVASATGAAGNTVAGTRLSLTSPLQDVASVAIAGAIGDGVDVEADERLRARLLARRLNKPMGGSNYDYVAWALEISGITRAWSYSRAMGVGTVGVCIVSDDQAGSIIPTAAKVAEVQAHIDAERPVTAEAYVYAPTPRALDLSIRLTPDSPAVRQAVTAELADLIRRESVPAGTILLSHINEAISAADGEVDHTLVSPIADVARAAGEITVLGSIAWQ